VGDTDSRSFLSLASRSSASDAKNYFNGSGAAILIFKSGMNALWPVKTQESNERGMVWSRGAYSTVFSLPRIGILPLQHDVVGHALRGMIDRFTSTTRDIGLVPRTCASRRPTTGKSTHLRTQPTERTPRGSFALNLESEGQTVRSFRTPGRCDRRDSRFYRQITTTPCVPCGGCSAKPKNGPSSRLLQRSNSCRSTHGSASLTPT
jgi:hypothetical protein